MNVNTLISMANELGIEFYTGVPDSLLNPLCEYLFDTFGSVSEHHIVAANEGGAVGLAAGHYLTNNKPSLVYMQNSGIGNAINPICSLLSEQVYAIPTLFVIGWRGEPGIKDEPQHIFQGEITLDLLKCLNIEYYIMDDQTSESDIMQIKKLCQQQFDKGLCYALVVRKGGLSYKSVIDKTESHQYQMSRERAVEILVENSNDSTVFVSTTGKLSRELYEIRERNEQSHDKDFMTVGSMGHALMIAQGIALAESKQDVWCLDGDGAMLMHMGGTAIVGACKSNNLIHIVINNGAHESVGGMATAASLPHINLSDIARACGYQSVFSVSDGAMLSEVISKHKTLAKPVFIEVKTNTVVRSNLGRPTTTPKDNKQLFMNKFRR